MITTPPGLFVPRSGNADGEGDHITVWPFANPAAYDRTIPVSLKWSPVTFYPISRTRVTFPVLVRLFQSEGADIYYRIGASPNPNFQTLYLGPVTLQNGERIYAYAPSSRGRTASVVTSAEYLPPEDPDAYLPVQFQPPDGSVIASFPINVVLYQSQGGTIYWKMDGPPSLGDRNPYTGPVTVLEGHRLYAYAAADAFYHDSPITSAAYVRSDIISNFTYNGLTADTFGLYESYWSELDETPDYNWSFDVSLPVDIKRIEIYQTTDDGVWSSGQTWATTSPIYPVRNLTWPGHENPDEPFRVFGMGVVVDAVRIHTSHGEPVGTISARKRVHLIGSRAIPAPTARYFRLMVFLPDESRIEQMLEFTP